MNFQVLLQDIDKRRALLLSVLVHMLGTLLLAWSLVLPQPQPIETFIVIDIGTPAESEVVTEAPTSSDPAPQSAHSAGGLAGYR